jgi:hypothetical protein
MKTFLLVFMSYLHLKSDNERERVKRILPDFLVYGDIRIEWDDTYLGTNDVFKVSWREWLK